MKKSLLILIIISSILSCSENKQKTEADNRNRLVIEKYFKHFNNHEWIELANMYAVTSDFKDPTLGDGIIKQTRQQIIRKYSELNAIFSDLHDEVIQIYPSGSKYIIVELVSTGTAPDHSKFRLPICAIFTIENGVITKDFSYFDNFDEQNVQK